MSKKSVAGLTSIALVILLGAFYIKYYGKPRPLNPNQREHIFLIDVAKNARIVEAQLKKQASDSNLGDDQRKLAKVIKNYSSDAAVLEFGAMAHTAIGQTASEDWMEGCQVFYGACREAEERTGTRHSEPNSSTANECLSLIKKHMEVCGDSGALNVSYYDKKVLVDTVTSLPKNSILRMGLATQTK